MTPLVQISRTPRMVQLTIDGASVSVPEGTTILEACRRIGTTIPTLCYLDTLHPVNVCRVCVVEVKNSRVLVPACSRAVEPDMQVLTDSERVRHSRKMVLEFLASSVDLSTTPDVGAWLRDYAKCILCYKCVEACGTDYQNTFAIAVAGRGFEARISTELAVELPESACVYCGNCIAVCPTGALMAKSEYDLRRAGAWDESRQTAVDTICPYCGVGCTLTLHVQDNEIVRVSSPLDHDVTRGNLCIKGRFGWRFVQNRAPPESNGSDGRRGRHA